MLDILVRQKEINIGKRKLTIYRIGVGFYYRLLSVFLNFDVYGKIVRGIYEENDFIDYAKRNLEGIIRYKHVKKMIRHELKNFTDDRLIFWSDTELIELGKDVIDFNTPKKAGSGKEIISERDIEQSLNGIILDLIVITGQPKEYCMTNINAVEADILIRNYLEIKMLDMDMARAAYHSQSKDYNKFKQAMRGRKVGREAILDTLNGKKT